jgi:hypothetical protein
MSGLTRAQFEEAVSEAIVKGLEEHIRYEPRH